MCVAGRVRSPQAWIADLVLHSSPHFYRHKLWHPQTLSQGHSFSLSVTRVIILLSLSATGTASSHINHLYYHDLKTFVNFLPKPLLFPHSPTKISWAVQQSQSGGSVGGRRMLLTCCIWCFPAAYPVGYGHLVLKDSDGGNHGLYSIIIDWNVLVSSISLR